MKLLLSRCRRVRACVRVCVFVLLPLPSHYMLLPLPARARATHPLPYYVNVNTFVVITPKISGRCSAVEARRWT